MDPTQLEQVIMNLVVNSRDAMPKGGRLTMQTENVSFEHETYSRNEAIPAGDYAVLSLSDTGSGMDKDTLDKIFEPFFTTKEQGKGTGLGLSTVYGIIKQNRGFISVYSEIGRGTAFKIYFPRHSAKRTTTKSLPRAEKVASLSDVTVLLVEDEAGVRQLTEKMLHSFGMNVLVAASGEEAIRIARSRRQRIDLVLTDIVMSGKSGWEIAEIIPQFHAEAKFLFSSGYPEKHAEKGNVKVYEGNYISKPYSKTELQSKIKKLLAISSSKD
jgi:CheY-like chemotaxis protein